MLDRGEMKMNMKGEEGKSDADNEGNLRGIVA